MRWIAVLLAALALSLAGCGKAATASTATDPTGLDDPIIMKQTKQILGEMLTLAKWCSYVTGGNRNPGATNVVNAENRLIAFAQSHPNFKLSVPGDPTLTMQQTLAQAANVESCEPTSAGKFDRIREALPSPR